MNKVFFSTACAVLALVTSTADAQILGGRGGVGGGLGGLGGIGGGVMGSVSPNTGVLQGTADSTVDVPRHVPHHIKAPRPDANADGAATLLNGRASANAMGAVSPTTQQVIARGNVAVPQPPRVAVPTVSTRLISGTIAAAPGVHLGYLGGPRVAIVGRREALIEGGVEIIPAAEVPVYVDRETTVLENELAGTGVTVERRGKQIYIEMPSDITFAFDKYDIRPRFYGILDRVGHTLDAFPSTYVDVIGHTDAIGSYGYNQALSERRASSVATYLVHDGAQPARLYVEGRGKTEPVASNTTIEGRAANRRVEIVLTPA